MDESNVMYSYNRILEACENKETTCKDMDDAHNIILSKRSQQKLYIVDEDIKKNG